MKHRRGRRPRRPVPLTMVFR